MGTRRPAYVGSIVKTLVPSLAGLLLACAFLTSFVGVYRDREHGDAYLFLKHRPSTQWVYDAPTGESDRAPRPEERADEEAYRDFVEAHRGYARSVALPSFF